MTDQVDSLTTQGSDGAGAGGGQGTQQATTQTAATQATTATQQAVKWPDDWRKQLSGGDEKLEKQLHRFTDPNGIVKSWKAAEQKISSGEYKRSAIPDNPTPEQLQAWRTENGIPESHDKYDLKFDDKLKVSDDDKPYLETLYKFAHENNFPKAQVEKIANFMFANRQQRMDQIAEMDSEDKQTSEETLRSEMGGDYKINMNIMNGLFDGLPEEIKSNFLEARLPNGVKLTNDPNMVKTLVGFAREINPAATVVPSTGGATTLKSITEEIAEIEQYMKTNRDDYFKDKKKQARFNELIVAQGKLQKKAG
jgi:hypothetical protein